MLGVRGLIVVLADGNIGQFERRTSHSGTGPSDLRGMLPRRSRLALAEVAVRHV